MGTAGFVNLCEILAKKHGGRLKLNRQLKRVAKTGESYCSAAKAAA